MSVVSVYCFGDDLPQDELVKKFIAYVINDDKFTEDFSPFDGHSIDVTPVIRSYILQQLLAIKGRYVNAEKINRIIPLRFSCCNFDYIK